MESCSKALSPINEKDINSSNNGISNDHGETQSEDKRLFTHSLNGKLFFAGEQWSQEENNADDLNGDLPSATNGHSFANCKENNSLALTISNKNDFTHNNNLIDDKTNLTYSEDKPHCSYLKFPMKVNNNIYHKTSPLKSDGMEEYFMQNASHCDVPLSNSLCNGSAGEHQNVYDDQINALNGEDYDEDAGCIYTYKGDNFEANLSHLIETCFSCGLPTTDRSTTHHGAVSIQRILNGSPHPNPNPQGNLYSPEMDFLEMDFDPGSNGDGPDSDCEDNSVLNIDEKYNDQDDILLKINSVIEPKTNNIPNEIRSLMCRRCEMCTYNEQKVNNTTSMIAKTKNDNKLYPSSYSVLDDRPLISQIPKDLNVKEEDKCSNLLNNQSNSEIPLASAPHPEGNVENNLNLADEDFFPDFSDGGEDADDEDDSTSEQRPPDCDCLHQARRNSSSSYFCPSSEKCNFKILSNQRFSQNSNQLNSASESSSIKQTSENNSDLPPNSSNFVRKHGECANKESKIPNHVFNESNNNLGSISAPEISPAKEFSPLEKFSRSISFHNQLSSPKYENVCFSHLKNLSNSVEYTCCMNCTGPEYCTCKFGFNAEQNSQTKEAANLEACVDRLSRREKSVFNISSNSSSSHKPHSNGSSKCQSNKFGSLHNQQRLNYLPQHINNKRTSKETYPQNLTDCLLSPNESVEECNDLASLDLRSPLAFKSLQPKSDDLSKDPNTASDDDHSSSPAKDIENNKIPKIMIWTERQATLRQVSQIGKSACGATAVINVLLALDHPRPIQIVQEAIKTRMRAEDAHMVDYLLSRSNAGTTHEDLIKGIEAISRKSITGQFFHMFPKRSFQLSRWLIQWIKKGGVPVATLNLQMGVHLGQTIPDSWHHQMVFGVGPQGIYLTNPLECVSDSVLSEQLCSDSVLLVRRNDLVSRWNMKNDKLIRLSLQPDTRWNEMSVLGQVVGVLKEHKAPEMLHGRRHLTPHISIPAAYQSGVTIFMRADNPHLSSLKVSKELPLLE